MITQFNSEIEPFNIDNFPSEYQSQLASYYSAIAICMDKFILKGFGMSYMGTKGAMEQFNKMNLFHYLAVYLLFISEDIKQDIQNGITYTTEEYIEMYSLECIRKNLACTGCSPDVAMAMFNLSQFYQGGLISANISYCDSLTQLLTYFKK